MNGFLKVKLLDIDAGKNIVVLHEDDARDMSMHMSDRVEVCKEPICKKENKEIAIVDVSDTLIEKGSVGIFNDLIEPLNVNPGDYVSLTPLGKPESVAYIKKKIEGHELNEKEIYEIVKDIVDNKLSEIELTSFVTASYIRGYSKKETVCLTNAMVDTGEKLKFEGTTVDKHCIGGVAGNRTTMLIVPILASLGIKVPKTSSRAITSPAGTADTMEVLCGVNFNSEQIKKIVNKIGGCIVWGGGVNLAPADDDIIRVEYPLSIDPEGQVLASIMSKKKSVGSDYVLIDVPYGEGAKVLDKEEGKKLGEKFVDLGKDIGMKVKYILTDGSQPIGNGIGPVLEARDVLAVLHNKGPTDFRDKGVMMAGVLLEFSGNAPKGQGIKMAREALESGKALKKMKQIIKAQGGDPEVKPEDLKVGKYSKTYLADSDGIVEKLSNKSVASIARSAGCPKDQRAGAYLHKKVKDKVNAGDELLTIYAQSDAKLEYATKLADLNFPYVIK